MQNVYFVIWSITTGFVVGNYIYQILTGKKNWLLATERSFFQIIVVATICIRLYFMNK